MSSAKAISRHIRAASTRPRGTPISSRPRALSTSAPEEPLDLPAREGGGYYPAKLGETLKERRYRIVGKLGWGQYSSVWLAEDSITDRHVALKVLTSNATRGAHAGLTDEVRLLARLASAAARPAPHPGHAHVLGALDHFVHPGVVRGQPHICIASEVVGPALLAVIKQADGGRRRLPLRAVKRLSRQILRALAYLHDECGIVHCDLKPSNFLVVLDDVETLIRSELATKSSSSQDPSLKSLSDPSHLQAARIQIKLADFGHSNWKDRHLIEFIQPEALRAPEVIVGADWDTSADIWNLGCLIFEFLTGHRLFKSLHGKPWSSEDEHLFRMRLFLGEDLPEDFRLRSKRSSKFFDETGQYKMLANTSGLNTWPPDPLLEAILRRSLTGVMQDAEIQEFAHFLRALLRPRPEDRACAAALLDHEWLKDP